MQPEDLTLELDERSLARIREMTPAQRSVLLDGRVADSLKLLEAGVGSVT